MMKEEEWMPQSIHFAVILISFVFRIYSGIVLDPCFAVTSQACGSSKPFLILLVLFCVVCELILV